MILISVAGLSITIASGSPGSTAGQEPSTESRPAPELLRKFRELGSVRSSSPMPPKVAPIQDESKIWELSCSYYLATTEKKDGVRYYHHQKGAVFAEAEDHTGFLINVDGRDRKMSLVKPRIRADGSDDNVEFYTDGIYLVRIDYSTSLQDLYGSDGEMSEGEHAEGPYLDTAILRVSRSGVILVQRLVVECPASC